MKMRLLPIVALLVAPFVASVRLSQPLDRRDFDRLLTDNDRFFVAFTSPTLDLLQPFHAAFDEGAVTVKTPFVKIDCEKEQELCDEYDVNEYPAIRLFERNVDGKGSKEAVWTRYRGRRTKTAMRSFVLKHEVPALAHIETTALAHFKQMDDFVVIAYLRPDQVELLDLYRSVAAKHYHSFIFGYVSHMATADAEGLAMPSIVCYSNIDGDNEVLNGHFTGTDIERMLETAKKMVIGEFSERNVDEYLAKDKLTVYVFAATEEEQRAVRRELTPVAKKYEQYTKFGVADAAEYAPTAKNFGLSEDVFPALAVHAPLNDEVFLYKQGRSIVGGVVDAMLTSILQGKARSGQVFGEDAPEMGVASPGHDEL